ncbi:MAG: sigma-70 family RNA polymerase sigma factor [Phycisphaerales bacterium]|nr:sigma-70 family RNA polymerase sigma factor [Phycisphaerales bacterium]
MSTRVMAKGMYLSNASPLVAYGDSVGVSWVIDPLLEETFQMVGQTVETWNAPIRERALPSRVRGKPALEPPVQFMDDPEFHRLGAARRIFDGAPPIALPSTSWYQPLLDDRRRTDGSTTDLRPPRTLVLTAKEERVIFGQFNYARFRLSKLMGSRQRRPLSPLQNRERLSWCTRASALRRQIAETNLALVLAMAKRVRSADLDFGDLISEGNMALMRSIDKFDATRGFKFSTYACRAILKAYSRLGAKTLRYRQHFPVEFDPTLERGDAIAEVRSRGEQDSIREVRELFSGNRAVLSEIERTVIFHRYGLDRPVKEAPMTLEQIGLLVGVTKERVRQIQCKALEKIRAALIPLEPTSRRVPPSLAGLPN